MKTKQVEEVKHIKLHYPASDFEKLKRLKDLEKKHRAALVLSWEDFVFSAIVGK